MATRQELMQRIIREYRETSGEKDVDMHKVVHFAERAGRREKEGELAGFLPAGPGSSPGYFGTLLWGQALRPRSSALSSAYGSLCLLWKRRAVQLFPDGLLDDTAGDDGKIVSGPFALRWLRGLAGARRHAPSSHGPTGNYFWAISN